MLKAILEQAEREYPAECCGLILARQSDGEITRLRPCTNVQEQYHRLDPKDFPLEECSAYFIEPKELLEIDREMADQSELIRVIYHSHIDADAYFSDEDEQRATDEDGPVYPGTIYLVISVCEGRAELAKWFRWNPEMRLHSDAGSCSLRR